MVFVAVYQLLVIPLSILLDVVFHVFFRSHPATLLSMIGSNMVVVHCCPVFVGCALLHSYMKKHIHLYNYVYSNRDLELGSCIEAIQINSVPFSSMHENNIPLQHAFFLGWCNLVVAIGLVLGNIFHVSWGHVPGPPILRGACVRPQLWWTWPIVLLDSWSKKDTFGIIWGRW